MTRTRNFADVIRKRLADDPKLAAAVERESICARFLFWAQEAVDEWDGESTADLFVAILRKTGEDGLVLEAAKEKLREGG